MRIMPIMNDQISYKGTMIFEDNVLTSNVGISGTHNANFANIDPKKIESITSTESFLYFDKTNRDPYQTLIKMDSGDYFFCKACS